MTFKYPNLEARAALVDLINAHGIESLVKELGIISSHIYALQIPHTRDTSLDMYKVLEYELENVTQVFEETEKSIARYAKAIDDDQHEVDAILAPQYATNPSPELEPHEYPTNVLNRKVTYKKNNNSPKALSA